MFEVAEKKEKNVKINLCAKTTKDAVHKARKLKCPMYVVTLVVYKVLKHILYVLTGKWKYQNMEAL